MVNYNKLREFLADIEHQQWMIWSKELAKELSFIDSHKNDVTAVKHIIRNRLKRWKINWKPYVKLPEDVKEFDREWADKILDNVPIKCPVYQCGGLMVTKERPYPKGKNEDDFPDGMDGDTQTPDLVCSNCGAIYSFQRFKNARR